MDDRRAERRRVRARQIQRRRRVAFGLFVLAFAAIVVAVVVGTSGGGSSSSTTASEAASSAGTGPHHRRAQPLPGTETVGDHKARNEPVPILMYHVIGTQAGHAATRSCRWPGTLPGGSAGSLARAIAA